MNSLPAADATLSRNSVLPRRAATMLLVLELEPGLWLCADRAGIPQLMWYEYADIALPQLIPASVLTFELTASVLTPLRRLNWHSTAIRWIGKSENQGLRAHNDVRWIAAYAAEFLLRELL